MTLPDLPQYSFKAHWTDDKRIGVVACLTKPDGGVHLLQTIIDPPPEQRPWVGLTEEYLAQIDTEEIYGVVGNHMAIAMAVEAMLKEKNT